MSCEDREALVTALGHRFGDAALLETALTHPSHAHETDGSRGYERLEFLGDAVLDLAVAHLLFVAHQDWREGELTRARAALVNQDALAERARALDLGGFLKLGGTEQRSGGAQKDSILANCLEAIVGAVFLDAGMPAATDLVRRLFGPAVTAGGERPIRDAKTELQEWAHAQLGSTPSYRTLADSGSENDAGRFTVEVAIGGEPFGRGAGRSKRLAERAAAEEALARRGADSG